MSRTYGFYSSAALFLLPALCMVVPSGYGYGAGLCLALFHAKAWREPRHMPAHGWWLYASFVGLALVWLLDDWLSVRGGRSFEKPLRFSLLCRACGICWFAGQGQSGYGAGCVLA